MRWSSSIAGVPLLLLLLGACGGDPVAPAPPPPPPEAAAPSGELPALPTVVADAVAAGQLVLCWSAHAGARLEPCGCVAGMHGGLARRASLLGRVAAAPLLSLECGGWSGGAADYQLLRAGTYVAALRAIGVDLIGLGAVEVSLGAQALRDLVDGVRGHVVCANVRAVDGTELVRASGAVHEGSWNLVVTSVVPAEAAGAGLLVEDPAEALLRLLPELQGRPLVVMADLDEDGLAALARAVPGIAVLVGGAVAQPSPTPVEVGSCRIVHVANEGKTIGWWPWQGERCAFELITDDIPDHPAVRSRIHAYQEALGAMDLAIDERIGGLTDLGAGDVAGVRYVGSQTCQACHPEAVSIHRDSRHFHSYQTLVDKHYHHDPDCLRCHVTGLARPDGFQRRAPEQTVALVSCESCHGRGSRHVAERAAGRPGTGTLEPVTPATCTRCHDGENSPHFAWQPYWEKIRHDR